MYLHAQAKSIFKTHDVSVTHLFELNEPGFGERELAQAESHWRDTSPEKTPAAKTPAGKSPDTV